MSKDKYDEYYLTLTQAKNLEKRGLEAQALEVYLKITEEYLPDTDYAFERAVLMLEKRSDFEGAQAICHLALKRIKEDDMRGKVDFYTGRLERLSEKAKAQKTAAAKSDLPELPAYLKRNSSLALGLAYLVVSILLSLPDKLAKLAFLIFFALTLLLIVEVVKQVQKNLSIKYHSIVLLVAMVATLVSASLVEPPEWTNFVSFQGFRASGAAPGLEATSPATTAKEPGASEIDADDMDKLQSLIEKDLIIADYTLSVDGNRLDLTVYLAPGASENEAKKAISGLFLELNSIKGYSRPGGDDDSLGPLYKDVSASIDVFDSFGIRMMRGQLNRANQKISWR